MEAGERISSVPVGRIRRSVAAVPARTRIPDPPASPESYRAWASTYEWKTIYDIQYFVQQQYAIRNPGGFAHYGELCWGITASDGPGGVTRKIDGIQRRFFDYLARAVPYGPDDGTIAPWAVVASLPFAPEIVLPTIADFTRYHRAGDHR
jgi:hypothetical protein